MTNSLIKIAKDFHWEMAHRLPYHQGGCQNLHGHSYQLNVEIAGTVLPNGMLMDYSDLKAIVKPLVDELDHAFLCSEDDELMKNFLKGKSFKVVYIPYYSTAENIAGYFLDKIATQLKPHKHLRSLKIRVAETVNTYAEISVDL